MEIYFVVAYYIQKDDCWVVRLRDQGYGVATFCTPNYTGNLDELKGLVFLNQPDKGYDFRVFPERAMQSVDSFVNKLCSLSRAESQPSCSCPVLLYAGTDKERAKDINHAAGRILHMGKWKRASWILNNPTLIDL